MVEDAGYSAPVDVEIFSAENWWKRDSRRSSAHLRRTFPQIRVTMADYDAIIIGAGHNGLILAAYLGKAGLKTLLIDRRHVAGGGLSTLEDPRHPGFLHNTHAFFQRAITAMPWYCRSRTGAPWRTLYRA